MFEISIHLIDLNVIKLMIENGADMNHITDALGNTPLHIAVERARGAIIKLLIEAGAFINATNKDLDTPLHLIGKFENSDDDEIDDDDFYYTAELLIKSGADLTAKNADGKTPLGLVKNEKRKFLNICIK